MITFILLLRKKPYEKSAVSSTITLYAVLGLLSISLLSIMVLFPLTAKSAAIAAPLDYLSAGLSDANSEKIDMEEMKIQGNVKKPNIMYIIPRADIKIEMELHDEYFLPASTDSSDVAIQSAEGKMVSPLKVKSPLNAASLLNPPLPSPFNIVSQSLFYINKPEIKEGSCVACHYPGMVIPKNASAPQLLKELNKSCLHCHPSRYYHICWKEAEKGVSQPLGQGNNGNCKKCHAPWMQSQGTVPQDTERKTWGTTAENAKGTTEGTTGWTAEGTTEGTQQQETKAKGMKPQWHWNQPGEIQPKEKQMPGKEISKQGYDIDTFCVTCHKY